MRSRDVVQLYDIVGPRARVTIVDAPLSAAVPVGPGSGGTTAVSSH